jgi:hypothetical protein
VLPGERINAIRGISEQLATESTADTHLILSQFGVDFERRVGEIYPQLTTTLSDASDVHLEGLQEFLFPGVGSGPGADEEQGGPWTDGMFRLFISHRNEQKRFATDLRTRLSRWGVDAFVAHDQIEPTQVWQEVSSPPYELAMRWPL